jgi:hypothetical protein
MNKLILGTAVVGLLFSVPAQAGSTLAIAGGATASHIGTTAFAAARGPAVAGSLQVGTSQNVGAGFAVSTPAGGLSTGIGASVGNSFGSSGTIAGPGGTGFAAGQVNNVGLGVGGGFTNSTP